MTPLQLLLVAGVGLLSGVVNTIAGGGSLITLPVLILLGLPPHTANGTNRIGVAVQSATSTFAFYREKALDLRHAARLAVPTTLGATAGAFLSVDIDEAFFKKIIAVAMVLILAIVLLRPARWIGQKKKEEAEGEGDASVDGAGSADGEEAPSPSGLPLWVQVIVFFAVGFYGGFLQAGVGVFFIASLSLASGLDLVRANAIKVALMVLYTATAIPVFVYYDQIDWLAGGALAVGSMAGGWVGTKMTVSWGPAFVRWVLAAVVIVSSTKLLGLW